MKTATVVKDKLSGNPFAIITDTGNRVQIFGTLGQGQIWAEWARLQQSLRQVISNLDVTLVAEENINLTQEYIQTLVPFLDENTAQRLIQLVEEKVLLIFSETKSDVPEHEEEYDKINELSEEENIDNWPITDTALATIDVAYKQIVIDYKAKAFNLDAQRAGILLQVKGARAMWDPNMPGGGGWRCPDNTAFGGQFTNRLGRGCTFGAIRRIGRSLTAASLGDIAKGIDDTSNVDLPLLNRAGKRFESAADNRDARLQDKFKNRALRRAKNLQEEVAKKNKKNNKITFRQAYSSLDGAATKRGRVMTAVGVTAKRFADDFTEAERVRDFRKGQEIERRAARRAGNIIEKNPPGPDSIDPNSPPAGGSPVNSGGPNNTPPTPSAPIQPEIQDVPTQSRRERIAQSLRNRADDLLSENPSAGRRSARRARNIDSANQQDLEQPGPESDYTAPKSPKREKRGKSPMSSLKLRRSARGENPTRITEGRAIERRLRGRTPRNTEPLRERNAKRLRRRALTLQGEPIPVNEENFGPYEKGRVDLPPAFVTGVNPDIFAMNKKNTRTRLQEPNNKDNVDKILRAMQSPISPIVDDLISSDDSPSKKLALEAQQQWVKDGGWKGLDSLARWFVHKNGNYQGYSHDEMRADVLSPTRDIRDVLDEYEKSVQPELRKIYDNWLESFNNPEEPLMDGLRSNMGLLNARTDTMKTNVDSDGSSIAPINKDIVRITAYALSEPNMPVVYIEDQDAGIAHLLTTDGEHLMSLARQKDGTMAFFPGSAANKQINAKDDKPSLRERIFKKRTASPKEMSQRARRREVQRSTGRTGLFFGKTTSGPKWMLGTPEDRADYLNIAGPIPDSEVEADADIIRTNAGVLLNSYFSSFGEKLGKDVADPTLSEDEILDYIDSITASQPRNAAILKNQLHNFLVLEELLRDDAPELVNNLKPTDRAKVLSGTKHSRLLIGTDTTRYAFTPAKKSKKFVGKKINLDDITAPIVVNRPPEVPVSSMAKPITGPSLVDGVGDIANNIVFDPQSGLYKDDNTGLFIEDLSGLNISAPKMFEPEIFDDMPIASYPTVRATPTGYLPAQFYRLSPNADPTGAGAVGNDPAILAIPRTFKDAIQKFESVQGGTPDATTTAVNRILGRNSRQAISSPISRVDLGDVGVPVNELTVGQLLLRARASSPDDSVWSAPNPEILIPQGDANDPLSTIFTNIDSPDINVETGLRLDLPTSIFYIPANSELDKLSSGIKSLNRALQLEHTFNLQQDSSNRPDLRFSNPISTDDLDKAWNTAASALRQELLKAEGVHKDARNDLTQNPRNVGAQKGFLRSGNEIEMLTEMLRTHIVGNPTAIKAIIESKRQGLESLAASRNKRIAMMQARIASGGNRRVGTFDLQPDILDAHGSANPPTTPRGIDEIELLSAQHRSQGLFSNPLTNGPQPLTDEDIQILDELGVLATASVPLADEYFGIPGGPFDGVSFGKNDEGRKRALLAHVWHHSGFNSLPISISEEELINAASGAPVGDGLQPAMLITRGFQGQPGEVLQFSTDYLGGDRFIPGQGGQLAGLGDYYSFNPSGVSSYHGGDNASIVGIITPNMNIVSQVEFDQMFRQGGPNYEQMWAVYNALGAPGAAQGMNLSHGSQYGFTGIQDFGTKDPVTGLYSPALLAGIQAQIDEITKIGNPGVPDASSSNSTGILRFDDSWGSATIEGILAQQFGGGLAQFNSGFANGISTDAEQERRAEMNAWFSQNLSWFVQLAQMRMDESVGNIADAKAYNERLDNAMRTLLYADQSVRMTMMGIDAFVADGIGLNIMSDESMYQQIQNGRASRIVVLNRSGMILFREPTNYRNWDKLRQTAPSQVPSTGGDDSILRGYGWR